MYTRTGNQIETKTIQREHPRPAIIFTVSKNDESPDTWIGRSIVARTAKSQNPSETASDCITLPAIFGEGNSGKPTKGFANPHSGHVRRLLVGGTPVRSYAHSMQRTTGSPGAVGKRGS